MSGYKGPRVLGSEYGGVAPGPRAPVEPSALVLHARAYPFTTTIQYAPRGLAAAKHIDLERIDARHECEHGALPHDRNITCACWSADRAERLAERPALTRPPFIQPEEAVEMLTTAARPLDDEQAPYGRKKDGTPRAKPGRRPRLAALEGGRESVMGPREPVETVPPPPPPAVDGGDDGDGGDDSPPESTIERIAREAAERIVALDEQLAAKRKARAELDEQITALDEERARIARAREALVT